MSAHRLTPHSRFLLSASRRLDTAHSLYTYVDAALGSISGSYPHQREQIFAALGISELLCVGLGRAVDMLQQIPTRFSVNLQVPATITAMLRAEGFALGFIGPWRALSLGGTAFWTIVLGWKIAGLADAPILRHCAATLSIAVAASIGVASSVMLFWVWQ